MRFFVDECCPIPLADALGEFGHDVVHAIKESRGDSDLQQADRAARLDRVLVSADYDFGTLAIRRQTLFVDLVLISPRPNGLFLIADALASQIHGLGDQLLDHLTVLEPNRIRRRPLLFPQV